MFLPKKYRFDIKNAISNKNKNLEIELRFRGPLTNEIIDSVSENLIEKGYEESTSFTVDYIGNTVNSNEPIRISKENSKYYETSKSNILNNIFRKDNYSMKLSINREIRKIVKEKPSIINELIREKDRTTFSKDNLQVDITRVKENDLQRLELEIEVIDSDKFNYEQFDSLAKEIYEIISVSYESIISVFAYVLSGGILKTESLSSVYHFVSKPRDLQLQDLTNDGILKPFAISLKADGVQKFLMLHNSGSYFIDNKNVNKINSQKFEKLSVYVGEYIESKNLYLPFDTIVFEDQNVKEQDYLTRYNFCKQIAKVKLNKINISEKPIYTYEENNVESFNQTISKVYQTVEESVFNIDGLIFTPIRSGYIANGQDKSLTKRVLSNYNDVCKYKKPEDLTIDFLVKDNALWSYDSSVRNKLKKPWFMNSNNISRETFLIDKWKNKVVEFTPIFNDGNIIYKPIRIREDKQFPNKLEVADKLFRLRQNPIEKETLEGKTTQLMRKYHNVIKRKMIANQTGYVIDIGSGKGGDLDKYANNMNIKKVFSIEPQSEFIEEYNRRLMNLKKGKEKFYNVQGGGEDTEKIIKGSSEWFTDIQKFDTININFMISLSFFWRDLKTLKQLANTITSIKDHYKKQKVLINFLTIEGTNVQKLFEDVGEDKIVLNTITMIKKGDNKIYVDIRDGKTVHDQEEYLVKLNQLWDLTKFFPRILFSASGGTKGDYILSKGEQTYSSLFMFGTAYYDPNAFSSKSSLLVDEKKGVKTDQGVMAHGDDETEPFYRNLTRIATLKKNGSLYHSLLKLLSEKYRKSDVFTRVAMAKDLSLKLDPDLQTIAQKINHGIKVHEGPYKTTKYNQDSDKWIFLHRTVDNEFEPLVFDDGDNHHFVFNSDSDLV